MIIAAFAKINPFLKITGLRQDGYHELELIFMPVSLSDTLTMERSEEEGLRLTCTDPTVPIEGNLITKAYHMVKKDHPGLCGMEILLEKKIPSGAGLGGGSADAAAFLANLSQTSGISLGIEGLYSYAKRLGADVPALLLSKSCFGRGIGEILTPVKSKIRGELLIVSPGFSCSTKEMYGRFDGRDDLVQPKSAEPVCRAMEAGDLQAFCSGLFNVFEQLLEPEQRLCIEKIKQEMEELGAAGTLMTGSGSCVFGLFETEAARDRAKEIMSEHYAVYPASLL